MTPPRFFARRIVPDIAGEAVVHVLIDDVPAGVLAVPPRAVPALLERLTRGECAASAATCAWQFTPEQCCALEPSVIWYHQDGGGSAFYCTEHAAELARICWETLRKLHEQAMGGTGQ